jgi:hypothetical protein
MTGLWNRPTKMSDQFSASPSNDANFLLWNWGSVVSYLL